MHSALKKLSKLEHQKSRFIIGLMSGTSLDGLDIALVKVGSCDLNTEVEVINFMSVPYKQDYLSIIKPIFADPNAPLKNVALANKKVAEIHADMVRKALKQWQIDSEKIDLIASHGQTVFHYASESETYSLQIGDGDHLAKLTGITTLSDFRQKHIAGGGEGAPLAPYADFLLFQHPIEYRVLLNIGGISNYTYLPKNAPFSKMTCADIGPGNTLMDQWVQKHALNDYGYDKNGELAAQGKPCQSLLEAMFKDAFFLNPSLKSTGPEYFNLNWLQQYLEIMPSGYYLSKFDVLATLNMLTASTIANQISILDSKHSLNIYVSGGGAFNRTLMKNLSLLLDRHKVGNIQQLNTQADAKEAVLFAVLANQSLFGDVQIFSHHPHCPAVSFGKISFAH